MLRSATVLLISHFISQYILPKNTEKLKNTQFLLVHALNNIYTSFLTYNSVIKLITQKYTEDDTYYNESIISISFLHIYHIIFYKYNLEDLLHHAIIPSLIYFHTKLKSNIATDVNNFFMCGFPGAIIYCCVILKRIPYIKFTKKDEIYLSYLINTYLRCPGILINVCYVLYLQTNIPTMIFYTILGSYNAIFYTYQSINRYNKLIE